MRSYIPQSEEQFFPIRAEGESSQENWPNQDADKVDLSATHQETNHSIYQIYLLYYLYWRLCCIVISDANIQTVPYI